MKRIRLADASTKCLIILSLASACAGCTTTNEKAQPAQSVLLTSPAGERFVGQQLKPFQVSDNIIGGSYEGWITLYNTEGVPFRLTGEVWLDGPPKNIPYPSDMPDGLGIFVRAKDGRHRYSLTPDRVLVKRRHHGGVLESTIAQVGAFKPPTHRFWTRFCVDATAERIQFTVEDQTVAIKGPIDMDGSNQIALGMGSKLRNLRLELLAK